MIDKHTIKIVLLKHMEILERYNVKSIAIFGSYAKDMQKEDSDVDLLVEFKEPISLLKHVNLIYELERVLGRKVEVVSINALKPALKDEILREAIWLL